MSISIVKLDRTHQADIVAKLGELLERAERGDVISLVGTVEYSDGYYTVKAGITDKFRMIGALTAAAAHMGLEE